MEKSNIKKCIEKYMKKVIRLNAKIELECGFEPKIQTLESLDYSIKDHTFYQEDKNGMCLGIDGNIFEEFSYNGCLFQTFGQKMIDELEKRFNVCAEFYDACHLDIVPNES